MKHMMEAVAQAGRRGKSGGRRDELDTYRDLSSKFAGVRNTFHTTKKQRSHGHAHKDDLLVAFWFAQHQSRTAMFKTRKLDMQAFTSGTTEQLVVATMASCLGTVRLQLYLHTVHVYGTTGKLSDIDRRYKRSHLQLHPQVQAPQCTL